MQIPKTFSVLLMEWMAGEVIRCLLNQNKAYMLLLSLRKLYEEFVSG